MDAGQKTREQLLLEVEELTLRLEEAEETLEAIRSGGVDALVVATAPGEEQLFTLEGADRVYRVFLESMSEGAVTLGGDGLILYANPAAHRLLAGAAEGLVGGPLRDLVCADERPRFDALLERARTAAAQAEICVGAEAGARPLSLSLHPLEDGDEQLIVAVLTDLADRKATEAALESERLAGSVFEQAGETIVVCDKDGVVIRASRAAAELAGREPLFRDFDLLLPLWTKGRGRRISLEELSGRGRLRGLEVRLDRDDGASFDLILNASPLVTPEQGLVGSVVTLTDITSLRQAEQTREALFLDLEQANKELATIESLSRAGLQLTTVDQLAHSIASQVAIALEADEAALLLLEGDQVRVAAVVPPIDEGQGPFDVGHGFIRTVMKMGRTLFIEDAEASRLVSADERARGNKSLLGSPLAEGRRRHRRPVRRLEAAARRRRGPAALPGDHRRPRGPGHLGPHARRPARRAAPRGRGARGRARRDQRATAHPAGRARAPAGADEARDQLALAADDRGESAGAHAAAAGHASRRRLRDGRRRRRAARAGAERLLRRHGRRHADAPHRRRVLDRARRPPGPARDHARLGPGLDDRAPAGCATRSAPRRRAGSCCP